MKTGQIKAFGITDVGLVRKENEDAFSTDDILRLYVVADGMGGHLAGEVASRMAVDLINKSFRKWTYSETPVDELYGDPDSSLSRAGNYILSSIRLANRFIYERANAFEHFKGMGTTVAVLILMPEMIISANVGDSRVYLIRNRQIEAISRDHSIVADQVEMGIMTVEEAGKSPMKHVLTRNLGSSEDVEPEIFEIEPSNNDRFILCTDGLTDLISDDEIQLMVENEDDPEILCQNFIGTALKRGGNDNATVISICMSDIEKPKIRPLKGAGGLLFGFFNKGLRKK